MGSLEPVCFFFSNGQGPRFRFCVSWAVYSIGDYTPATQVPHNRKLREGVALRFFVFRHQAPFRTPFLSISPI